MPWHNYIFICSFRGRSVKVSYSKLINCFVSSCRYRLYKRLFIELDHSGVLGILVHQVKEEVMSAIEVSICINVLTIHNRIILNNSIIIIV